VTVHAADVQDADGAGDLPRRLKRLYPWLKVVFVDGAYLSGCETSLASSMTSMALGRMHGSGGGR
jgi:hypothetical protein